MADQNLKQIQFKRTSTENKAPGADIVARGEIALNTHGRTLAIYTKDENDAVVQLAGKGVPFLDTSGTLSVDGTTTLKDNVTISPNKAISFETTDLSGEITRHIVGKCATNDGWYIGSGGTSNSGILEIGTIDDGAETIQFVQRGPGNVEARKLVLLDGSGNTTLPGDLRLSTNKTVKINSGSTLVLEMGVGSNDVYIKNQRGIGVLQLTNDSNLTFRSSQVYYAMDGRGPGKSGTLLTNVENERQLKQDNFPVTTGTETRWTKVALLKDPGSSQSRLQLMVTNGGNYGSTYSSVDFIDCSARNFPSSLTSSNIRNHLQVRRLGNPALSDTNQLRYSLVRTSEGLELWFMQRAFIGGVKVALLSIAGYTEYYLPNGYTTTSTAPEGLVESTAIRIYDEVNKPNVVDGTEGVLSINRGGTGGTSAAAARNNLGLGTAAIRDVGEGTGNLMEVGAFGLGGTVGAGNIAKGSLAETVKYLNTYGTCFFRVEDNIATIPQYSPSIYVKTGSNQLILSANHRNGVISVVTTDKTDGTNLTVSQVYTTLNKPSKADVGLDNLTNDAQVKKAGDTMSGDLTISKASPSFYLNAESGNSVIWFKYKGNETGAVWALPNTADSGEVRIRAKTSGGTTRGEFSFKSDGTFTSPGNINITYGAFNGKAVNTEYANFNNTSSTTTEQTVSISGSQHTPLLLNRPTNSNLSIGFKLSGMNMKRLGIDINGDIRYGEAENQTQNPWLLTSETVDRWIVNFGRDINVAGVVNSTGGFTGPVTAYNLAGAKLDLNDLTLNRTDPGHVKVYSCASRGDGDFITNKPSGIVGNFIVIVECIRKVNDTDYTNRQVLISSENNRSWERWLNVTGTTKSWTPWRLNVVSGNDDDVSFKSVTTTTGNLNSGNDLIVAKNARVGGNLGLGGASSMKYTDKGVVIGSGSALLETTDGRVIIGSSGGGRAVELRPGGPTQTNNLIKVTATAGSGGDTAIEYAQGAKIRSNNGGALIISAKAGQSIYLRPQGDESSTNETRIDASGNVVINGNINNNGTISASGIITTGQAPTAANHVTRKDYVDGQINTRLPLAGGSMTGNITMSGSTQVINATAPTDNAHLANKAYVDTKLPLAGGTLTGNLTMGGTTQIVNSTAPADNSHLTNKKYVDDKVASAISNAGDTYLPLAGGTVTGNLDVTGTRLKTWQLEVDSKSTLRGGVDVSNSLKVSTGNLVAADTTNAGGLFAKNGNVYCDAGSAGTNSNYWFRDSAGNVRGVIWSNGQNGDMIIRNQSGRELVFRNDGYLQLAHLAPGNTSTGNTVNGIRLQRGDTIFDSFNSWQSGEYVRAGWHFYNGAGVDQWLTITDTGVKIWGSAANLRVEGVGSFWDVEIRSDRRVKSNIAKIDNALDKVSKLSGNVYDLQLPNGDTKPSAGLIAQEVQEVLPEAVTTDNDKDALLRLNYNAVIALLVESVKELKAEIEELKSK